VLCIVAHRGITTLRHRITCHIVTLVLQQQQPQQQQQQQHDAPSSAIESNGDQYHRMTGLANISLRNLPAIMMSTTITTTTITSTRASVGDDDKT
jgi:hypothetical protein